jgi:hypothetical protein
MTVFWHFICEFMRFLPAAQLGKRDRSLGFSFVGDCQHCWYMIGGKCGLCKPMLATSSPQRPPIQAYIGLIVCFVLLYSRSCNIQLRYFSSLVPVILAFDIV